MNYTPEQIKQAIDEALGSITSFECEAVDELPQEGKKGTIYDTHIRYRREWIDGKGFEEFVVYDQYIWDNGKWVWFGTVDTYEKYINADEWLPYENVSMLGFGDD